MEVNVHDFGFDNRFLDMNAQGMKEKISSGINKN